MDLTQLPVQILILKKKQKAACQSSISGFAKQMNAIDKEIKLLDKLFEQSVQKYIRLSELESELAKLKGE